MFWSSQWKLQLLFGWSFPSKARVLLEMEGVKLLTNAIIFPLWSISVSFLIRDCRSQKGRHWQLLQCVEGLCQQIPRQNWSQERSVSQSWRKCTLISAAVPSQCCSSDIIEQKRSHKQQHALRNSAVVVFLDESTWCFSILCWSRAKMWFIFYWFCSL